ncbi:MAG TPA: Nif11-like leader peptide family natural product precursor [Verrucomicrobiaceae bacterium]|jgi:predicted ribosomally synthesized peptide with nif11-like leader
MATPTIASLAQAVHKDEALRDKIAAAQTFAEIATILGQSGYDVSPGELEAGCDSAAAPVRAELSDADLEKAVGGKCAQAPAGRLFLLCAKGEHLKEVKL